MGVSRPLAPTKLASQRGKCRTFASRAKAFRSAAADPRDNNPKAGRRKDRTPREKERNEAKFQRQAKATKCTRKKLQSWKTGTELSCDAPDVDL